MKERVTISVEPDALELARAEVEAGEASSVSAAFENAIRAHGKRQAIRKYVERWEKEHGPISEEAREWARKELSRASSEISSSMPER